ncbi:MAG: hypothetical protein H7Y59_14305 [Anaerolineales bacterium]|nr:hypothetical protein [Anaerolineales bacterium]
MQIFKEKNSPFRSCLVICLFFVLGFALLNQILYWKLCTEKDHNIPPNTEILVSACKRPSAIGVPGGETLFVREGRTGKMYLLDLRTGEKRAVPNDPLLLDHGVFLTSELVWLEGSYSQPDTSGYRTHYILDLTTGQRFELLDLTLLPRLDGQKFDTKYYSYFTGAEQVFIHHSENTLITLSSDFRQRPEDNVIFSQISLGSVSLSAKNGELLVQLMKDLGVDYEIVDFSLRYSDVASPTGKYFVRSDGIYLSETSMPVVTRDMGYYFRGWYYDESGVVFQEGAGYLFNFLESQGSYRIPSPLLKLNLPE